MSLRLVLALEGVNGLMQGPSFRVVRLPIEAIFCLCWCRSVMSNLHEEAIGANDGDRAAKIIQDALGIESDDVARYCFPKNWPDEHQQDARPQGRRPGLLIFTAVFIFGVLVGALCEAVVMHRMTERRFPPCYPDAEAASRRGGGELRC